MVFIDTGPLFASVVPSDPRHILVAAWQRDNTLPLVTTDYVIDETLTLLRVRGQHHRAIQLGRRLLDLGQEELYFVSPAGIRRAWEFFRGSPQRAWSFTDCTSRALMERLHIKHVLTFDHHFREFGGLTIHPNGHV